MTARFARTTSSSPVRGRPAPSKPSNNKKQDERNPDVLVIHLTEGDIRDFKVKRSSIKSVEYWEDMLMAEGERLVASRNFSKAFEYYLAVQARNPRWKGLSEHVDQLLFQEGNWALSGNERDKGIRLLTELHRRRPDYPGLAQTLARSYGNRVEEAVSNESYAYGRKILHELEGIAPNDSLVRTLANRFQSRAREIANQGEQAKGAEQLDALTEALHIWPKIEGVAEPYAEAFRALPTLDVGVLDVPRPVAPWNLSPASERVNPLLYRPLLRDESEEAMLGQKVSQIASNVEIGDLGRRLEIRLKHGIRWSDDYPGTIRHRRRSRPLRPRPAALAFLQRPVGEPAGTDRDHRHRCGHRAPESLAGLAPVLADGARRPGACLVGRPRLNAGGPTADRRRHVRFRFRVG